MKDSAWYHKLWRDKLSDLILKEDNDAAWINMRNLLDEEMPVSPPLNNPASPSLVIKLIKGAAYIASTAAIIATAAYWITHQPKPYPTTSVNKKHRSPANISDTITGHQHHHAPADKKGVISGNDTLTVGDNTHTVAQNTISFNSKASDKQSNVIVGDGLGNIITQKPRSANAASQSGLNTSFNEQSGITGILKNNNAITAKSNNNNRPYYAHDLRSTTPHNHTPKNQLTANHSPGSLFINDIKTSSAYNRVKEANRYNKSSERSTDAAKIDASTVTANQPQNDKEAADTKIDPVKVPTINTDTKEVKSSGNKSRIFNQLPKTGKTNENKSKSNTKKPNADTPPKYNYGLEAGYNTAHSLYAGIFGSYQIKPKWLINAGLRLNTYTTVYGEYIHQSYYSPDSIPAFKITDSRKVMAFTIPLTLEYKLTKNISLKGGPVINIPIKQSAISTKLGAVPNIRDTVYHTQIIDSALKKTTINKLNVGFKGGMSIQIKHFSIEAMYQVLTPYKINSGLGSYQKSNQNFQIGIGYRFK